MARQENSVSQANWDLRSPTIDKSVPLLRSFKCECACGSARGHPAVPYRGIISWELAHSWGTPYVCGAPRRGWEDPHPHIRSRPCRTEGLGYALSSTCLAGSPLAVPSWLTLGGWWALLPFRSALFSCPPQVSLVFLPPSLQPHPPESSLLCL